MQELRGKRAIIRIFMNTFTCDKCLDTFNKCRPDREAKTEFEQAPWNIPGDDIGVLCDVCFEEFKVWFASLTEEDHKIYRGKRAIGSAADCKSVVTDV